MSFFKSNNPFRHNATGGQSVDDVPPPPGPPPSHHKQQQGASSSGDYYAPPPGPPPSYATNNKNNDDDYAPPPGPPPPPAAAPAAPQHDWQSVVPDTSLFPPPPALFSGYERSSASNAQEKDAAEGFRWCERYPLASPIDLQRQQGLYQFHFQRDSSDGLHQQSQQSQSQAATTRLIQPETNTFRGTLQPKEREPGVWSLVTDKQAGDATVIGYPPLYLVQRDSPLLPPSSSSSSSSSHPTKTKTIYYECRILANNRNNNAAQPHHHHHRFLPLGGGGGGGSSPNNDAGAIGLALGFAALPYPPFRLPGWHRGSLGVHGDDGRRYVNDSWGGREFTAPFQPGQTVGLGMTFSSSSPASSGRIEVEVFFTREGKVDGRWDIHEELDASTDLPVTGLEGYHDIALAVGTYSNVGVEIVLDPARWLYRGA